MTLNDIIKYYETTYKFAKKTGMASCNWSNWRKQGYVSIKAQHRLEELTRGVLRASILDIPEDRRYF